MAEGVEGAVRGVTFSNVTVSSFGKKSIPLAFHALPTWEVCQGLPELLRRGSRLHPVPLLRGQNVVPSRLFIK